MKIETKISTLPVAQKYLTYKEILVTPGIYRTDEFPNARLVINKYKDGVYINGDMVEPLHQDAWNDSHKFIKVENETITVVINS
jgi:hypothetical protein